MNQLAGLRELVGEMNAGTVEFLLILGGNPVYTARRTSILRPRSRRSRCARTSASTRTRRPRRVDWHVPEAHYLEMWSDVSADDGTATIVQPMIAPLYNGKSAHEVIAALERTGRAARLRAGARVLGGATGLSMQAPAALLRPHAPADGCSRGPGGSAAAAPGAACRSNGRAGGSRATADGSGAGAATVAVRSRMAQMAA